MSIRLNILNFILKWTLRPALSRASPTTPARLRPWLDKPLEWGLRPARGTVIKQDKISDLAVPVLRITRGNNHNGTLLYFHGGAYIFGSAKTHRKLVSHICGLCGLKGLSVNYRLAPEHPFPAAIDDAFAVYKALLSEEHQDIVIAGDSAGGGLALALLGRILAEKLPKPAGLVAFSPWTDLTLSGATMITNDKTEYILPPQQIKNARDFTCPDAPDNPLASPLFADFTGAPPVLILAGSGEVLLDDSKNITKKMQEQGVVVSLSIYKNTPHDWVMGHGFLPEANQGIRETSSFIARILNK